MLQQNSDALVIKARKISEPSSITIMMHNNNSAWKIVTSTPALYVTGLTVIRGFPEKLRACSRNKLKENPWEISYLQFMLIMVR